MTELPRRPSPEKPARLPDGFAVALDRRVRRLAGGPDGRPALLGGSPTRLLRLSPAARRVLGDGGGFTVRDNTSAALARALLDAGIAHPVPGHLAGAAADVTVVIPVKDRPDGLRRLLAALATTDPAPAEVIVVDDGSADPATHREIAERAGARLVRHDRPRGPAAARNAGLAAAATGCVTFLDSDVVPLPGWLPPLLAHLADESVALAAPRIVGLPTGARPGWLERYERLRSSLDLGPDAAPVLPRSRVAYVPSAALLVRRAALGAGFDEAMHVAEDVDLGLRLHASGWRLRYEPAARVAHEHRDDPVGWWTRKAFYGTGATALATRHAGSVPPAVLAPWTAAVGAVALAGQLTGWRRWGLLGAVAVTGAAAVRIRRTLAGLRHPGRTAARLAALGLYGAGTQLAGLLVRHWWPLTAVGCLVSPTVRRVALAAALAEGLSDWWTHRPGAGEPGLDPVRYVLAHRADDLGYGAGLWWGAIRGGTPAALLPLVTRGRTRSSPPG